MNMGWLDPQSGPFYLATTLLNSATPRPKASLKLKSLGPERHDVLKSDQLPRPSTLDLQYPHRNRTLIP